MSLKIHESIPTGITVEPNEFKKITKYTGANIHETTSSKKNQSNFVSYLSFVRLRITDATAHVDLLTDKIRSKSNVFSKLKTPIFFDGYWFDGNVESIDPGEVESVSFFVNEGLPGVKDGNRIISIYSKKAKAG